MNGTAGILSLLLIVTGVAALLLIAIGFFSDDAEAPPVPKFKTGDVLRMKSQERWEEQIHITIVEVGRRRYRFYYEKNDKYITDMSFFIVDKIYELKKNGVQ